MLKKAYLAAALAAVAAFGAAAQQSGVDRDAMLAAEDFRRGVQAYDRYAFNEAILSLEKALSRKPGEALILDWLGRAYYRSGLEATAIRQWQAAYAAYAPTSAEGLLLNGRIETVRNRRGLYPELDENARYVEAGRYPSRNGDVAVYSLPTSVLANGDGSVWVAAYGSNELVRIDPNGVVRTRVRGPINGFDRPYDIARGPDGRMYVSEYKGNRVSVLDASGKWLSYIGSKGRGEGQFVGPQNLAVDGAGYLYAVDFGNRRVVKFAPDGKPVLAFGSKKDSFSGLESPTGIAAIDGEVFVADAVLRAIVRFDPSGNYLNTFAEGALARPESLRSTSDGKLLSADGGRVVLIDPKTGLARELGNLGGTARVASVCADANGNLAAADFRTGQVTLLTRMDDLASGLFVQIERVNADKFPEVGLELSVQDRRRRPIVGLSAGNFVLSEGGRQVSAQTFLGASSLSTEADVAFLVERSEATRGRGPDVAETAHDALKAGVKAAVFVSAGQNPSLERIDGPTALEEASAGRAAAYSRGWRFDLGLRLAATELLDGQKKRAVFFIGSGTLGERAFERYGLSELASYLANNGIVFYAALLDAKRPDREIEYLCEQTGGKAVYAYRPEGVSPLTSALREAPSGVYSFKYTSTLPTDFGRAYLPVEAEAYLIDRSGRDATGYFPPLE